MGHGSEVVLVDLKGLDLEIDYNRKLAAHLGAMFNNYIREHGLGTNSGRSWATRCRSGMSSGTGR